MTESDFKITLKKVFSENGLGEYISEDRSELLYRFSSILIETNKSFNLTAITDEKEIILKHFADCATVLKHIPVCASIIDIGCGAGFPSLPIAILRDDVKVTALDSTAKKINFINSTAKELSLNNIQAITSRAEDFAKDNKESFDVSISRAVARLNILDELCLPLTRVGGKFIAMKSSRGEEEYSEAKKGIEALGGNLENVQKLKLAHEESSIEREIYVFEKKRKTPPQYPRNYSQIVKKPL